MAETQPTVARLSRHTSDLLQSLVAKEDHFTLDWLVDSRPDQSYGIVVLFLAVLSIIPVIDLAARVLLMFIALRAILGYEVSLPDRLMQKPLSTRYLAKVQHYAIPALHRLEQFVRPRWPLALGIKRYSAVLLFLMNLISIALPIPFSNVPLAMIIFLMALAYLEHDGLLLSISLLGGTSLVAAIAWVIIEAGHMI